GRCQRGLVRKGHYPGTTYRGAEPEWPLSVACRGDRPVLLYDDRGARPEHGGFREPGDGPASRGALVARLVVAAARDRRRVLADHLDRRPSAPHLLRGRRRRAARDSGYQRFACAEVRARDLAFVSRAPRLGHALHGPGR